MGGVPGEERLEAATAVKEDSRYKGAEALKEQQAGAWIDIAVGGAFERKGEGDEEGGSDCEIFQFQRHGIPLDVLRKVACATLEF
jgi:hypothetical protein